MNTTPACFYESAMRYQPLGAQWLPAWFCIQRLKSGWSFLVCVGESTVAWLSFPIQSGWVGGALHCRVAFFKRSGASLSYSSIIYLNSVFIVQKLAVCVNASNIHRSNSYASTQVIFIEAVDMRRLGKRIQTQKNIFFSAKTHSNPSLSLKFSLSLSRARKGLTHSVRVSDFAFKGVCVCLSRSLAYFPWVKKEVIFFLRK
jgi:hypothetical protein